MNFDDVPRQGSDAIWRGFPFLENKQAREF
jgi:hypothetical protein